MRYFKMGEGPDYFLFRPYHLVHLEAPVTVAEVVLDRIPLGTPHGAPVAEVVALAKRDLWPGERLDGIGGFMCYGQIDSAEGCRGLVPIGLANHARVVRPIAMDEPISLDDVELDVEAPIVGLRQRQDTMTEAARVGAGTLAAG
jgi:predicted homoserine dehydrogenase-like protein